MVEAFQVADDVLRQGVQGISDLVTLPALINLDFADVRTIMSDAGRALLGIGMGTGEGRAILAAEKAISSPLLETSMEGARSILLSITGGADLSLVEVSEAAKVVGEAAHPDANIIFGANVDEELSDQVWVTVVATRFDGRSGRRAAPRADDPPHQGRAPRPRRPGPPARPAASTSPSSCPVSPRPRERGRRRRPSAHRRGGSRRAARGRQRGRRRGRRGPRLVRGREPADRLRRRRLHDGPRRGRETVLIDFFVAAPGPRRGRARGRARRRPRPLRRRDRRRRSTSGRPPAACPGPPPAWRRRWSDSARCRSPSWSGRDPARPRGRAGQRRAGLHPRHPRPDPRPARGHAGALRAGGQAAARGRHFRFPELAEALERFGAEGAEPVLPRRGRDGPQPSSSPRAAGTIGAGDLAAYEAIEREPIRAGFRGTEVLTNPPPSSGGILIAYCLGLLERLGERSGPEQLVAAMGAANEPAGEEFAEALYEEGLGGDLLDPAALDLERRRPARLDDPHLGPRRRGDVRRVTCSNGSGSGVLVPGTGVILNNMLGEEDLNPLGFHAIAPGRRVPSMMAPTVVLRDGEIELGLGSAGSNRIRSAILQTIVRVVEQGMGADEAVRAPRLHFEQGVVQAEPGIDEEALARIEGARNRGPAPAGDQPLLRRLPGGGPRRRDGCVERRRRPAPRR